MKKSDILRICLWIVAFAAISLCYSCGAKKKEATKKEEILKTDYSGLFRSYGNSEELLKDISYLTAYSITKVEDQNLTITTKKTFTPQNPNIPASYIDGDGKKYDLNNTAVTEETIIEKNNKKSENYQNFQKSENSELQKKENITSVQKIKLNTEHKKVDDQLKVNRDALHLTFWGWLFIAIVVLIILAYLNKRFGWFKYVTSFVVELFQIRKK
jgi:hypothetical protein